MRVTSSPQLQNTMRPALSCLLFAVTLTGIPNFRIPPQEPVIKLTESSSTSLPKGFRLNGIGQVGSALIAWSDSTLVQLRPTGIVSILQTQSPIRRVNWRDQVIHVRARDEGWEVRAGINGRQEWQVAKDVKLAEPDTSYTRSVGQMELRARIVGGVFTIVDSGGATLARFTEQTTFMQRVGGDIVGVSIDHPFTLLVYAENREIRRWDKPAQGAAGDGYWVSGPLLKIGRCWMRSIADRRSDRRVISIVDSAFAPIHTVVIDVPITFVFSDTHSVYAVRDTGSRELVHYNYDFSIIGERICGTKL